MFLIERGAQEEAKTSKKLVSLNNLTSSGRNKPRVTLKREDKISES